MTSTPSQPSVPAPESQPRKRRRWPWVLLGLFILLALIVAFLPAIVAGPGRPMVVGAIDSRIAGSVKIEALSLSWFGGQRVGGFTLVDPEGNPVLTIKGVSTGLSIWSAMRGNLDLGDVSISGVTGEIVAGADGSTNLLRAIAATNPAPPAPGPAKLPPSLAGKITLDDAKLTVRGEGIEPVTFDALTAEVDMPGMGQPVSIHVAGRPVQGKLAGNLDIRGRVENLTASDGTLTLDKHSAEIAVTAKDLPNDGLDGLLGQRGVLTAALGRTLSLEATAKGNPDKVAITLTAVAPNLTTDIAVSMVEHKTLELTRPAIIKFKATPELTDALAAANPDASTLRLKREAPIEITAQRLVADLGNPAALALHATLAAERDIELTGDPAMGDVTISNLAAQVRTERLAEEASVSLNADLTVDNRPGKVSVTGKVAGLMDDAGRVQTEKMTLDASATIANLPTALADRLAGQNGLLIDAAGDRIDLAATARSTGGENVDLTLSATTPRLTAQNIAVSMGKSIALTAPAVIQYKLSPNLANRYLASYDVTHGDACCAAEEKPTAAEKLALAGDADLTLTVEKLTLPRPDPAAPQGTPAIAPGKTTLIATLQATRLHVTGAPRIGEVFVDGLKATLTGDPLSNLKLTAQATATDPSADGLLAQLAGAASLPVTLDLTTGLDDALQPSAIDAKVAARSPNLNAALAANLSKGLKHLSVKPSKVSLAATPTLLRKLEVLREGQPAPSGPTALTLDIQGVEMPLGQGASLNDLQLAVSGAIKASADTDPFAALGREVTLTLNTEPVKNDTRPVKLSITADRLSASLPANVTQKGEALHLALASPGKVKLTATNALLALGGRDPMLAAPAAIELDIAKLNAAISPFALNTVVLDAKASLARLELGGEKLGDLAGAALADTTAQIAFDGPKGAATLRLDGQATAPGQSGAGPVKIDAAITQLLGADGAVQGDKANIDLRTLTLQRFPTAFVDAMAKQNGRLLALAGPALEVTASGKLTGGKGTVDAKLTSQRLTADAGVRLAEGLELTRPLKAQAQITPETYKALTAPAPGQERPADAPEPMQLAKAFTLDATVAALRWPTGDGFDPAKAVVDALVKATRIEMIDPGTKQTVVIDALTATAKAPTLAEPLVVALNAKIPTTLGAGGGPPGVLSITTTIRDLYQDGAVNRDAMSLDLDADIKGFPVALLDSIQRLDGMLLAALGPTMDLTGNARLKQMQGPVTLSLKATNAVIDARAALDSAYITLAEPVRGELIVTRELSDKIFSRMSPVLKGIRKDGPVTLVVASEGFRIPHKDFSIERIAVPSAVLDLGKVTVENDVIMRGLLSLMRSEGGKEMPGWFTPAVVRVANGRLTFDRRLDLLLNNQVHVATWGEADLTPNDGEHSRYTQVLAIAPRSLARAYKLENLGPDDYLRIPVRGTSRKPEVDFSQAISDVGKLAAQSEAAKANPLAGALVRELTKKMFAGPPVPPSSVNPLPWKEEGQAPPEEKKAKPAEPAKSNEEKLIEGALELLKRKK